MEKIKLFNKYHELSGVVHQYSKDVLIQDLMHKDIDARSFIESGQLV